MRKWIGKSEGAAPARKSKLVEKKASIITVTYEAKGLWDIEVQEDAEIIFDDLQIPNAGQNLEPGEPSIPQEGLYVAIPKSATVVDVQVVKTKQKTYTLDHQMKPAPEPTTDPSSGVLPALNPKQEIYETDDAFPGVLYKNMGVQQLGDVNVLHLMIYPVQYQPLSNTITLYKKIELEVTYEFTEKRIPLRGGSRKRVPAGYDDQILNFDNI